MTIPDEELAYVSFKNCGCLAMAVMQSSKRSGRMVAQAARHGERIVSMTAAAVRVLPFRCDEHTQRKVASPDGG